MPNVRAIRKKLRFEFAQHLRRWHRSLRQRFGKKLSQHLRFYIRKDRLLFDVIEIFRQQIYHLMTDLPKFECVH